MTDSRLLWKIYNDPKSGKNYYHNVLTKETTWEKPLELHSPEEREEILIKEKERLAFFSDMEANIKNRVKTGLSGSEHGTRTPERRSSLDYSMRLTQQDSISTLNLNRSISTFDEEVTQTLSAKSSIAFDFAVSAKNSTVFDFDYSKAISGDDMSDRELTPPQSLPAQLLERAQSLGIPLESARSIRNARASIDMGTITSGTPLHTLEEDTPLSPPRQRSNSTGTVYVDHTMATQDVHVTIKVVCTVVRSHMLESQRQELDARATRERTESSVEAAARAHSIADLARFMKKIQMYDDNWSRNNSEDEYSYKNESVMELRNKDTGRLDLIFRDGDALGEDSSEHGNLKPVPAIEEIEEFFTNIYSKSQLESSSIIMCLIYCERLMNSEDGVRIKSNNWRSIMFACLVMASKVWDDLSFWNVDFSLVCPEFTLARLNELESSILEALGFVIKVPAGEYAMYYFHARSIATNLGFTTTDINTISPLTWDNAQKLQISAEKYIRFVKKVSASSDDAEPGSLRPRGRTLQSLDDIGVSPCRRTSLGIDEIISPSHLQADGTLPQRRSSRYENGLRMIDSSCSLHMTESQNSLGFDFTDSRQTSPKRVVNMQDPDAVFLP